MAVRKEIHGLFFTPNSEKEINKQQTTNGLSHGNNNKKKSWEEMQTRYLHVSNRADFIERAKWGSKATSGVALLVDKNGGGT